MLSADRLHVYRLTGCPSDLPLSVCMNSDSLVIFCTRLQPLQAGLRWGLNINSSNLACHKESAECCWSSSRQTSKSAQPWPDNSFSCTEWWYCSLTGASSWIMALLLLDHMMPIRLLYCFSLSGCLSCGQKKGHWFTEHDFLKAVNDSYPVAGMITLSPLGKHTVQYETAKNIYWDLRRSLIKTLYVKHIFPFCFIQINKQNPPCLWGGNAFNQGTKLSQLAAPYSFACLLPRVVVLMLLLTEYSTVWNFNVLLSGSQTSNTDL